MNNQSILPDNSTQKRVEEKKQLFSDENINTWLASYWSQSLYFRRYLWLAVVVFALGLVFSALSAYTSFSYARDIALSFATPLAAIIIAIGTLGAFELMQQMFYHETVKVIFERNRRLKKRSILAVVAMLALSAFLSSSGGHITVRQSAKAATLISIDSIYALHALDINKVDMSIQFNENANSKTESWRIINEVLPALNKERKQLIDKRDEAINAGKTENIQREEIHSAAVGTDADKVKNIGWVLPFLILGCVIFVTNFLHESALELDAINENKAPTDPNGGGKAWKVYKTYGDTGYNSVDTNKTEDGLTYGGLNSGLPYVILKGEQRSKEWVEKQIATAVSKKRRSEGRPEANQKRIDYYTNILNGFSEAAA